MQTPPGRGSQPHRLAKDEMRGLLTSHHPLLVGRPSEGLTEAPANCCLAASVGKGILKGREEVSLSLKLKQLGEGLHIACV